MTEAARSVATAPVRHRDVTWEDPLVGAALARDLSGLDYLLGIAEGRIPPPPIAALLGMSIVRVEPGQVTFGLDVGEHLSCATRPWAAPCTPPLTAARRTPPSS